MKEMVFGRHSVLEILKAQRPVNKVLLARGVRGKGVSEIKWLARQAGVPFLWVDRKKINQLLPGKSHQGVLAFISPRSYATMEDILHPPLERKVFCIVDEMMDPGNLGAIIRTARAFNIDAVIISRRRASPVTSTVSKASGGAVEHIPVVRVGNIVRAMERLKEMNFWSVGADPGGEIPLERFRFPLPLVLILGNEEKGLRALVKERCDFLVRIPMNKGMDSLNVSLAGGIFFYELYRQKYG